MRIFKEPSDTHPVVLQAPCQKSMFLLRPAVHGFCVRDRHVPAVFRFHLQFPRCCLALLSFAVCGVRETKICSWKVSTVTKHTCAIPTVCRRHRESYSER